jgi:hypothetical protein
MECEIKFQPETQVGSRHIVNRAYLSDLTLVAELVKVRVVCAPARPSRPIDLYAPLTRKYSTIFEYI